jgi:hypothetical protein
MMRTAGLIACLCAVLICLADCRTVPTAARPVSTYPGPGRIILTGLDDGYVAVDGDLQEWGHLPGAYVCERWHRLGAGPESEDRAMMRVARDSGAFYAAFDVVDAEVANTHDVRKLWMGDAVELFLDLRPDDPDARFPLGLGVYSQGCYQIIFTPVTPDGRAGARLFSPQMDEAVWGRIAVASEFTAAGYTIEVGIPFSILDGADSDRLDAPIGLDAQFDDGLLGEEGQTVGWHYYCWQGQPDSYFRPDHFGRTVPRPLGAPAPDVLCWVPGDHIYMEEGSGFVNGLAVRADSAIGTPDLALDFRFEGRPYDRPEDPEAREVPEENAKPRAAALPARSWEDPVFGLRCYDRRVRAEPLVGGRYYVDATCRLPGTEMAETARFYYEEMRGSSRMSLVTEQPGPADILDRLGPDIWIWFDTHYVSADTEVEVNVNHYGSPWLLSETASSPETSVRLRLDAEPLEGGEPVAGFGTVLDPRTDSILIDTAGIPDGTYAVRARLVGPDGTVVPVVNPGQDRGIPVKPTSILFIARGDERRLDATLVDAAPMLTSAVAMGNPGRIQFPNDDAQHSYARNVWDLQLYEGRIYVGNGDWNDNQGPITIRSFDPRLFETQFDEEFSIDDESVDRLFVLDGRLVVPGTDAMEPWAFGNVYIKERGEWRKIRTVPNGIHVYGAAWFDGRLFVTLSTEGDEILMASDDWGETWTPYVAVPRGEFADGSSWGIVPLGDRLFVSAARAGEFSYALEGDVLRRIIAPFAPGATGWSSVQRAVAFQGKAVYSVEENPLFVVEDPEEGGRVVSIFVGQMVRDIIVRDGAVHVLTSRPADEGFSCEVYSSGDLRMWTRAARFTTPAVARSLERAYGQYYVGLGCKYGEAEPASGLICRLARGSAAQDQ